MADPMPTPIPNATPPSREDIQVMARAANLVLPPAYQDELVAAYGYVRAMIARLPVDRPRGDEPAQVFDPTRYLPVGEA